MCTQVVVWNSDARNKPELEVDIELLVSEHEVPGFFQARFAPELEVEIEIIDGLDAPDVYIARLDDDHELELVRLEDEWFLADDELVVLDDYTVYDEPPRGYADAYRLAG